MGVAARRPQTFLKWEIAVELGLMSREYGTPPNQLWGDDYGHIGNFIFNRAIFLTTIEDFPSQAIVSRKEIERVSRKRQGKSTAADKLEESKRRVGGDLDDYARRRRSRNRPEVA